MSNYPDLSAYNSPLCLFCGAPTHLQIVEQNRKQRFRVNCRVCLSHGPEKESPEEALLSYIPFIPKTVLKKGDVVLEWHPWMDKSPNKGGLIVPSIVTEVEGDRVTICNERFGYTTFRASRPRIEGHKTIIIPNFSPGQEQIKTFLHQALLKMNPNLFARTKLSEKLEKLLSDKATITEQLSQVGDDIKETLSQLENLPKVSSEVNFVEE